MRDNDALLVCEESGGFAFRGHIPELDGILSGLMIAEMIVAYGKPLSAIVSHLQDLVGPHAYDRHDIAFPREGYEERKQDVYRRMREDTPTTFGGSRVVRVRDDDGFKFYLEDGSWVLVRMSGTEPLMRVYSEAPTQQRVEQLIGELERRLGVEARQPAGAAS
jgi:phosphomannomutase